VIAYLLLGIAQVVGLVMIPFGFPGVWIQVAAIAGYAWWTEFALVGPIPVLILASLALMSEIAAMIFAESRSDTKARRRVGLAALLGGGAGALVGYPLPLLGSLFGGSLGAVLGSFMGVIGVRLDNPGGPSRAGMMIAATARTAAGLAAAIFTIFILLN